MKTPLRETQPKQPEPVENQFQEPIRKAGGCKTHSIGRGADIARMQLATFAQLQEVSPAVPVIAYVQIPIAIGGICGAGPTTKCQHIGQAIAIADGFGQHCALLLSCRFANVLVYFGTDAFGTSVAARLVSCSWATNPIS